MEYLKDVYLPMSGVAGLVGVVLWVLYLKMYFDKSKTYRDNLIFATQKIPMYDFFLSWFVGLGIISGDFPAKLALLAIFSMQAFAWAQITEGKNTQFLKENKEPSEQELKEIENKKTSIALSRTFFVILPFYLIIYSIVYFLGQR